MSGGCEVAVEYFSKVWFVLAEVLTSMCLQFTRRSVWVERIVKSRRDGLFVYLFSACEPLASPSRRPECTVLQSRTRTSTIKLATHC